MSRFFLIVVALGAAACHTPPSSSRELRSSMIDAYATSEELFPYVWNPATFNTPASTSKIMALLDRLSKDFHNVQLSDDRYAVDPGFTVTLKMQQDMLADIRRRFANGDKEYANWRLRAISGNCVSCHTRYHVRNDFLGVEPTVVSNSFEDQLAAADFLLATRQFDRAAEKYLALAQAVGGVRSGTQLAVRALKQWLVIEVRVKDEGITAAESLSNAEANIEFSDPERQIVKQWEEELRAPLKPEFRENPLLGAKALLAPTMLSPTDDMNEAQLVSTLRATALLHKLLETTPAGDNRRKAEFLLALAYTKIPIQSFEVLRELYLEQCIRTNPGTPEARSAFLLYLAVIEEENTGSGGTHIDHELQQKIDELKKIALGGRANT